MMFYNFTIYDSAKSNVAAYACYFVWNHTLCVTPCGDDGGPDTLSVVNFLCHHSPEEVAEYLRERFETEHVMDCCRVGEKIDFSALFFGWYFKRRQKLSHIRKLFAP